MIGKMYTSHSEARVQIRYINCKLRVVLMTGYLNLALSDPQIDFSTYNALSISIAPTQVISKSECEDNEEYILIRTMKHN